MPGIGRLLLVLALSGIANLAVGTARAAAPEWNPVRTHPVQIGPEAGRLVVGFRATAGNSVVKAMMFRPGAHAISFKCWPAMTRVP